MDYFQYLSDHYNCFKDMTKEEILASIKQPNNTIRLINDVKDFIFGHGYVLSVDLVLNYLLNVHNFSKEIDNFLINEILDYHKLEVYKHIFDKKTVSFKGIEFKLLENGVDINQLYLEYHISQKQYSHFFIPFLSDYIYNRLRDVIIIERENLYVLLNKDEIRCNYNNFFVPTQNTVIDTNMKYDIDSTRKYLNLNKHIKYFSLAKPYREEEYNAFEFDIQVLHDHKNMLTKEKLLSLIKDLQKYKNIVDEIIIRNKQKQLTSVYSPNQMFVFNNHIHQSYFKLMNIDKLRNCNISYYNLERFFSLLYPSSNIFMCNNKKLNFMLNDEILNWNNILYIVFKTNSPFYSLKLDTLINSNNKVFRNNIISHITTFNVSNISFYLNTLYTFFKEINSLMSYDTLPLTDYSHLVFKIFLDLLFLDLDKHNFLCLENQFIVYGTRKQTLETYNKLKIMLQTSNINITNIQIYDKLLHSNIEVFGKKISFVDIDKSYLFENIDTEDDNNFDITKNITIKKTGLEDNESNLIINIEDPMLK